MSRIVFALLLSSLLGFGVYMSFIAGTNDAEARGATSAALSISQKPSAPVPPSPIHRCMNMGGALEAPKEGAWGYTIRDKDFTTLKLAGFDTVRIPIKWSAHAAKRAPYYLDRAFLARVDEVVRAASRSGLRVIINVHHYDELNDNPDGELPRLYAIWDQLFAHYASAPETVMFEFLNEPHTEMTIEKIDTLNRNLLGRLRSTGSQRWVIIGGGNWGTLSGLIDSQPPYDPRAMVTFHYYEPFEFTHQGAPWAYKKIPLGQVWGNTVDHQSVTDHFREAAKWRDRHGMAMFLGEFGVYGEVPDDQRARWLKHIRKTSEQFGFGWCHWDYATSLGIYDVETEQFKPGALNALFGDN